MPVQTPTTTRIGGTYPKYNIEELLQVCTNTSYDKWPIEPATS